MIDERLENGTHIWKSEYTAVQSQSPLGLVGRAVAEEARIESDMP